MNLKLWEHRKKANLDSFSQKEDPDTKQDLRGEKCCDPDSSVISRLRNFLHTYLNSKMEKIFTSAHYSYCLVILHSLLSFLGEFLQNLFIVPNIPF